MSRRQGLADLGPGRAGLGAGAPRRMRATCVSAAASRASHFVSAVPSLLCQPAQGHEIGAQVPAARGGGSLPLYLPSGPRRMADSRRSSTGRGCDSRLNLPYHSSARPRSVTAASTSLRGRLRLLSRHGGGRVEQVQVAVDRLPQLVLGVTTAAAMVTAPVVIPVRVVNLAQVTEGGI
jgi:hypothetical protein